MIPIIIATLLLVLWTAGQWYFNYKQLPRSIANNPFGLPVGGRIAWCAVAWAVTFCLVPVAMAHVADFLRFLVLLTGGSMVMVGALPIHEYEDGVGGDLYNGFAVAVFFCSQILVLMQQPLALLCWVPVVIYGSICINRAKEWPSWRLFAGFAAYAATVLAISIS